MKPITWDDAEKVKPELYKLGWTFRRYRSYGYICRICHDEVIGYSVVSPNYGWYHNDCVLRSPTFIRTVRKLWKEKQENGTTIT